MMPGDAQDWGLCHLAGYKPHAWAQHRAHAPCAEPCVSSCPLPTADAPSPCPFPGHPVGGTSPLGGMDFPACAQS